MRSKLWLQGAVIVGLAALMSAAACGGDDTTSTTSSTSSSAGGSSSHTSSSSSSSTSTTTSTTSSTGGGGTGPGGGGSGPGGGGQGGGGTGPGGGGQGGGGTGPGGTGGIGGAPANDACPGEAISLAQGSAVAVMGTTIGAVDDYTTFCSDTTATQDTPDVVYEVTLTQGGNLTVTLDDAGSFNGAISLRSVACDQRMANDQCADFSADGETLTSDLAPGTYWVVVDGGDVGQAGDFSLSFSLAAPVCGDGIVNSNSAGEECDLVPSDPTLCNPPGSPNECQIAPPLNPEIENCPGSDVFINQNQTLQISGTNFNLIDEYIGNCAAGNTGGRDAVYHFHPQAAGTLTLTVGNDMNGGNWCTTCPDGCPDGGGCWIPILYARSTCADAASEIACFYDATFTTTTAVITFPVVAFGDYWVFVDANGAGPFSAGPYFLDASLTP